MAEYDGAGGDEGEYGADQMSKTWSWDWQEGEMKAEMTCVHSRMPGQAGGTL